MDMINPFVYQNTLFINAHLVLGAVLLICSLGGAWIWPQERWMHGCQAFVIAGLLIQAPLVGHWAWAIAAFVLLYTVLTAMAGLSRRYMTTNPGTE